MDLWFAGHERHEEANLAELRREEQRLRTAALEAMFQVELITTDPRLVEAGSQALNAIDRMNRSDTRDQLDQERTASRSLLYGFVSASKPHVADPGHSG